MTQRREPPLCAREVCSNGARGWTPLNRHPSREPLAHCSDGCFEIAQACALDGNIPALDSWSWLPSKPREVRAHAADEVNP